MNTAAVGSGRGDLRFYRVTVTAMAAVLVAGSPAAGSDGRAFPPPPPH